MIFPVVLRRTVQYVIITVPATKELHAQECKNNDEEEEEKNKRYDGLHGVHQRDNQVPERRPVPLQCKKDQVKQY